MNDVPYCIRISTVDFEQLYSYAKKMQDKKLEPDNTQINFEHQSGS